MDETGLKVLEVFRNGGNSVSNIVIGASGPFEKRQMRIYRFFSGKSQTFVQEVLSDGFTGNLVTDGAACYENWTNKHNGMHPDMAVVHAGCMAHARRKFVEAAEVRTDLSGVQETRKKEAGSLPGRTSWTEKPGGSHRADSRTVPDREEMWKGEAGSTGDHRSEGERGCAAILSAYKTCGKNER